MDTVAQAPVFDHGRWNLRADELAQEYRAAAPFPNIVLDDFLDSEAVGKLYREFDDVDWMGYRHYNEDKQGANVANLPPFIGSALAELNSPAFLSFLTRLTGIQNLIADPALGSGGIHQSGRGGFLNIHADFTVHPYHSDWHRRINVLVYLNERWERDWGGELELWATDMSRCVRKVAPARNRCVIFNTSRDSFHGHPEPMACPPGVQRRSIALYYYTVDKDVAAIATNYRARPQDTALKSALMYLDRTAVAAFHKLKATLRVSDSIATRIMAGFRKKH